MLEKSFSPSHNNVPPTSIVNHLASKKAGQKQARHISQLENNPDLFARLLVLGDFPAMLMPPFELSCFFCRPRTFIRAVFLVATVSDEVRGKAFGIPAEGQTVRISETTMD